MIRLNQSSGPTYRLADTGEFVIENYNLATPFSSFFPGIAGKTGIPMWVFYVNRGQSICSMGIQDKDHPIMEFLPANWAYQLAPSQGFRTFLKLQDAGNVDFYEPFQDHLRDREMTAVQRMRISASHLVLEEENTTLGLHFRVEYHTVPEDSFAGLIRRLQITNLRSDEVSLTGLDGLPLIIPYGIGNFGLKHIRRLMEAFVEVANLDEKAPLFKAKVEPADRPDVLRLEKGNFYVGFEETETGAILLNPVVDPQRIFGKHKDYAYPASFLESSSEQMLTDQATENHYPSAMSVFSRQLKPGETSTINSIIGHAESREALNKLLPMIATVDYVTEKARRNVQIVESLTQYNLILSADPRFDRYVRQNFLDNVLRGGFPYTLKGGGSRSVLHLYSRKHGDLERDYNDYRITPTPYSQGNGNFRDINQNRRSDLLFNPDVGARNLEHFFNLIQLDGFNPLVIKELRFSLEDEAAGRSILEAYLNHDDMTEILTYLQTEWTPGELLEQLRKKEIEIPPADVDGFLSKLMDQCRRIHDTDHGEGYWSDHWTYNLDLLENYLAIYPENLHQIMFEELDFTFHDSSYFVLPRDEKYVLWEGRLMQLDGVVLDEKKDGLIKSRSSHRHLVRIDHGRGEVYHTNLFTKMLSIILNKLTSLDPSGLGVEMETDKPNWYDALNGLPGLMGSSLSETLEVKRNIRFLLEVLETYPNGSEELEIFGELHNFCTSLAGILSDAANPFNYWQRATALKESYRQQVHYGLTGDLKTIGIKTVQAVLQAGLERIEEGVSRAWDKDRKIPSTYFFHEVTDHKMIMEAGPNGEEVNKTNARGLPCFKAEAFQLHHLPHFLEGPVHYLRCQPSYNEALELAENIRHSDLFDAKLKMYKVNADLEDEAMEIGRARVFSPGWFENESIWLHMEYKYMLELLRNGLHDQFYADFKQVFIPFMDPEVYGRSVLENSSFLVSSANPDPELHGTGFVARLSGATAEFIHILQLMTVGERPFHVNGIADLVCKLEPALPGWLFTDSEQSLQLNGEKKLLPANTFTFMFLGEILVTYHNPSRKDCYGPSAAVVKRWKITTSNREMHEVEGEEIEGELAEMIRNREVSRVEIELA